jgi:hypothetical protein
MKRGQGFQCCLVPGGCLETSSRNGMQDIWIHQKQQEQGFLSLSLSLSLSLAFSPRFTKLWLCQGSEQSKECWFRGTAECLIGMRGAIQFRELMGGSSVPP